MVFRQKKELFRLELLCKAQKPFYLPVNHWELLQYRSLSGGQKKLSKPLKSGP